MSNDSRLFHVIWPNDGANRMTSDQIKGICSDADSWASFLAMLLERRRFAVMRIYEPQKREPHLVKVLRERDRPPTYASLA